MAILLCHPDEVANFDFITTRDGPPALPYRNTQLGSKSAIFCPV